MKYFIAYLLVLFVFLSCTHEKKTGNNVAVKADTVKKAIDTKDNVVANNNKADTTSAVKDTTPITPGAPEVTSLPFGYRATSKNFPYAESYFISLLSQNKSGKLYQHTSYPQSPLQKTYALPLIKSFEYIPIPQGFKIDSGICSDGKPFSTYLKLKVYQYRLPDIYNYQCYYKEIFHYRTDDKEYSVDNGIWENCVLGDYERGYFILYNPKTLTAKVITIYWDTEYDEIAMYRFFYIDKAHNIEVYDGSNTISEGGPDAGDDKPTSFTLTKFSISPNGEIIKKNK